MPDPKTSRRRKGCLIAGTFALFILALVATVYWASFLRGRTVGDVERIVRAEIPPGSTRPEVESVLKKHGIRHAEQNATRTRRGGQTLPELAGLSERDIGCTTEAYIDDAHVDLVYTGMILVYFLFDREGRLARHLVYPWVNENHSHVINWYLDPPPHPPVTTDSVD